MDQLTEAGEPRARTHKEVAEHSDVVFTMRSSRTHRDEHHWAARSRPLRGKEDLILIEMSTMKSDLVGGIGGKLEARGVGWSTLPSREPCRTWSPRTLAYMVGGKKEIFERIKPIIERWYRASSIPAQRHGCIP